MEDVGGDSLNKAMKAGRDTLASVGDVATSTGKSTTHAGLNSMSPVLQYLTALTKGDSADMAQATQPQVNQIKDSFSAIRNMISQQPRGGGKAGVLAEQGSQQTKQIGDMQSQARQGAAGQLGSLSSSLAGLGVDEQKLGLEASIDADKATLEQRAQNMGPGSFATGFKNVAEGIQALI